MHHDMYLWHHGCSTDVDDYDIKHHEGNIQVINNVKLGSNPNVKRLSNMNFQAWREFYDKWEPLKFVESYVDVVYWGNQGQ